MTEPAARPHRFHRFRVYPSQRVHLGKPTPHYEGDDWHHRSLCGRDLIGYPVTGEVDELEVCTQCAAAFAKAVKTYRSLQDRFGD